MELTALLTQLQADLQAQTEMPVYLSYDPTAFAKRDACFLVLGLKSWKFETPFESSSGWCYGFTALLELTLLMPPETDVVVLTETFQHIVLESLASWDCAATKLTLDAPKQMQQFARQTITTTFEVAGVVQEEEETT